MSIDKTRLTKKPITIGLPLELFHRVRERVISEMMQYEAPGGSLQRWIIKAIKAELDRGVTVPREEVAKPDPMPPGSLAEARYQVERLKWLEQKPGQYPPVRARAQREREAWEDELAQRQKRNKSAAEEVQIVDEQVRRGVRREQDSEIVRAVRHVENEPQGQSVPDDPDFAEVQAPAADDYQGDDIV